MAGDVKKIDDDGRTYGARPALCFVSESTRNTAQIQEHVRQVMRVAIDAIFSACPSNPQLFGSWLEDRRSLIAFFCSGLFWIEIAATQVSVTPIHYLQESRFQRQSGLG